MCRDINGKTNTHIYIYICICRDYLGFLWGMHRGYRDIQGLHGLGQPCQTSVGFEDFPSRLDRV